MSRPFIPAPNTASVELIFIWGGQTCENVFHVQKGSPYSLADLQAVRAAVITWWSGTPRTVTTSPCVLTRIRTKALDSSIAPMEDFTLSPTLPGTQPGGTLPNNATLCIKLNSGFTGRSARGRWYVVGLPQNALFSSTDVLAVTGDGYVNQLNALRTSLASGGHTMVVVSYRHNNAWRTTAVNFVVVSASYTDLHIDSQRRRLAGRGA